jgi:hypothetical protein
MTPSDEPEIRRLRRGKSRAPGHVAERHFGNRGSLGLDDRCEQVFMFARIDLVVTAGQHGERAALDGGAMGRLIDAAREPRDDDETGFAEIARQLAGEF